jgi:outer membrane receptor for ferrienterochelin and colicin
MAPMHGHSSAVLPTLCLLACVQQVQAVDAPAPVAPPPAVQGPAASPAPVNGTMASETLTIVGDRSPAFNQTSSTMGTSTYDLGLDQILGQSQGADASFNEVLLRMPGVAQDSFGQVHLRGEHANLQYRIDGILLPDAITAFGQEIDTRFAHDVTLITGALPAQYGLRTAGVVDITTKSGASDGGGELSIYGGSADTIHTSASYGASKGAWDVYTTVSALHDDLGIENPTSSHTALHDDTAQYHGFIYATYHIDQASRLSLIASGANATFQIPDNPGQTPSFTVAGGATPDSATVDENQLERNAFAILAYQTAIGPGQIQIAPFIHDSQLVFSPDPSQDLAFTGVAGWLDQRALTSGIQIDASLPATPAHTVRAGASYLSTRATADTSTEVFPVDALGQQTSTTPMTIADASSKVGTMSSLYCQDEWRIVKPWTVNYGLRVDNVDAYVNQSQVSPRISTTLALTGTTTIHGGYARYFTPPPLESVSQEAVASFIGTSNQAATTLNDPVSSERANDFDAGISQRVGDHLQIGLDGYYKQATNQLDEGQFGSAVIFTPFNYRDGRILGTELTATYQDHGLTGYANVALSKAQGRDIDSAEFLFTSQELAYAQNHWIYLDHDQRYTVSIGLSYQFASQTQVSIDGIGGTGLRDGFDNTDHLPAYATANLGVAQTWRTLTVRLDVVNIFDRVYQIRDGSGIGVAAPQYAPRRSVFAGATWDF